MRSSTISICASTIALLFLSIAPTSTNAALSIDFVKTRRDGGPIDTEYRLRPRRSRRRKRDANVAVTLDNSQVLYSANVSVGTPPQNLILQLDTGSSDIWLPASSASLCQQRGDQCEGGTFDSSSSSSFKDIDQGGFKIEYVDGSGAKGDYVSDNFEIGGATIKSLEMGLATTTVIGVGVAGIGYDSNEGIVLYSGKTSYPNLIDQMVSQKIVNSRSYSLWLNDLDANTGSVLFGAIDTEKFTAPLIGVPILKDASTGNFTSFAVTLSSVAVNDGTNISNVTSSGFSAPVILDAGTSMTYLPDDITNSIWNSVGAVESQDDGVGYVDCDLQKTDATINFGFGGSDGPTVKVKVSELVFDPSTQFSDGSPACAFGILPAGQEELLFGDSFLRSTYVVYDLDSNVCYLANTVFNSSKSNIKDISTGNGGVPGVSVTASQALATQTFTGVTGPMSGGTTAAADNNFMPGKTTLTSTANSGTGLAQVNWTLLLSISIGAMVMASLGAARVVLV